jgi:hypothetical protein
VIFSGSSKPNRERFSSVGARNGESLRCRGDHDTEWDAASVDEERAFGSLFPAIDRGRACGLAAAGCFHDAHVDDEVLQVQADHLLTEDGTAGTSAPGKQRDSEQIRVLPGPMAVLHHRHTRTLDAHSYGRAWVRSLRSVAGFSRCGCAVRPRAPARSGRCCPTGRGTRSRAGPRAGRWAPGGPRRRMRAQSRRSRRRRRSGTRSSAGRPW